MEIYSNGEMKGEGLKDTVIRLGVNLQLPGYFT